MKKILCFIIVINILTICNLYSQDKNEIKKNQVTLSLSSSSWTQQSLILYYTIYNNTKDTITILKPRPAKKGYVPTIVEPEFYKLSVFPEESLCMYSDFNENNLTKNINDFVTIPPSKDAEIRINADDFARGICDSKTKEISVVLSYKFNRDYTDKAFFNKNIKEKADLSISESEKLLNLFKTSYKQDIVSDTVKVYFKE